MVFFTNLAEPPSPGMVKDHKNTRFFCFKTLPYEKKNIKNPEDKEKKKTSRRRTQGEEEDKEKKKTSRRRRQGEEEDKQEKKTRI